MMNFGIWRHVLCLALASLLLEACGKDELKPQKHQENSTEMSTETSDPQGAYIALNLEGNYDINELEVDDELRSFSLERKNNIPQIKLEAKDYDIALYLRQIGNPAITQLTSKATCTILADGKRNIRVQIPQLQLQGQGQRFAKGNQDWYICGVIGNPPATPDEAQEQAERKLLASNQSAQEQAATQRDLPLGFPWTKLSITQDGHGEQKALRLNLVGTLLNTALRNNIVEAVEAHKVRIKSSSFAFSGNFDPSQTTDEDLETGKHLRFLSSSSNQTLVFYASPEARSGTGNRILSGHEYTPPLQYLSGVMPRIRTPVSRRRLR